MVAREAAEYRQYFAFLQANGYLAPGVEELELEDLQGAQGLQALRVTVAPEPAAPTQSELAGTIAAFEWTPALAVAQPR